MVVCRRCVNIGDYVNPQQIDAARHADLYNYLLNTHPDVVIPKYGSLVLREDKHIWVRRGYYGYSNFRTGETGSGIDYLVNFLGYSFQTAVLALADGLSDTTPTYTPAEQSQIAIQQRKDITITIPEPTTDRYRQLFAYLAKRKIPTDLTADLVQKKLLYQDCNGNLVFITPEQDYIELRGTNTYADTRCRHRKECNNYMEGKHTWCTQMDRCNNYKKDSFHGCKRTLPDRFWYYAPTGRIGFGNIYICEAAIDAISLYCLLCRQDRQQAIQNVYVSIGGVCNQSAIDRIVKNAKNPVILAVDNDVAGADRRSKNPNLPYILPESKDWNGDLLNL